MRAAGPGGRSGPPRAPVWPIGSAAMPDVLLYADTERSAALRHEIPIAIGDPFGYAEVDGRAIVLTSSLEQDRIAAVRPDAEIIEYADVGFYELLESGLPRDQMMLEMI